jgi:hypothetical protein
VAALGYLFCMKSRILRALAALTVLCAGWVALVSHPQPLFAYSQARANVTVHSFSPIPPTMGPILDEALRRVSSSPLWDPALSHHVFLCDRFYPLFAFPAWRSGGVTQVYFTGNIFLRQVDIEHGTLIGRNGRPAEHDRPLAYYVAHEIAHHLTVAHTGRVGFRRLRPWQREGYADYLAKGGRLDLPSAVAALRRGAREMDPQASGLYDRYRLLVAYELDNRHLPLDALLLGPIERQPIEQELLSLSPAPAGGPAVHGESQAGP